MSDIIKDINFPKRLNYTGTERFTSLSAIRHADDMALFLKYGTRIRLPLNASTGGITFYARQFSDSKYLYLLLSNDERRRVIKVYQLDTKYNP